MNNQITKNRIIKVMENYDITNEDKSETPEEISFLVGRQYVGFVTNKIADNYLNAIYDLIKENKITLTDNHTCYLNK